MKVFAYLLAALVALAGAGAAQAQSSNDTYVLHGTVERVDHAANRVYVRGDNGRDYVVDISQGHASGEARTPGQEVTVYGRGTGDNRIEATNITADRDYRSASAAERERFRPRGWEQLHGQVVSVQEHRLRLRTDDGQTVVVDMSRLPDRREEMIRNLSPGTAITVIGDGDSRTDRFVARNVRFDDRDLNRQAWGGQGLGVNAGETQIHGRVETIHQDNLRLRTDDGRIIRVNIDPVRDNVRERVTVGQRVTVVGVFTDRDANKNEMTARTMRVDAAQSSAVLAGEQQVRGTVEAVSTDNLRIRTDDGRVIRVDTDPVRDDVQEKLRIGQRVTVFGVFTDKDANKNEMRARAVRVDSAQSSTPAAASGEQRIQGTVDTIHEGVARLKTDDGRTIRVDLNPLGDARNRVKVGQRVTVVGVYTDKDAKKNEMSARTVRVEGAAASGENQVRGTIETIHQGIMRLKTDDGRTIRVDINPLRDNARDRIKVGQRVTVVGDYTDKDANKNEMTARTVRVDDAASASPSTNRPRNADDCKDRGWSNYNNPKFKNQGDCVSYVNSRK